MKNRSIIFIILTWTMIAAISGCSVAFAYDAGDHWKDLRAVLFGDEEYRGNKQEIKDRINILEYATQLCIDQFNNSGSVYLERLRALDVSNLPENLEEINLDAPGTEHRKYTHQGWDHDYSRQEGGRNPDWKKRWEKRQTILYSSIEKVFGLKQGNGSQNRAFAKLLYYTHMLGDHIALKDYQNYENNINKEHLIPLAGTRFESVIGELIDILPALFPRQNYTELERKLINLNREIESLTNDSNLNNDFSAYKEKTQELRNTLSNHISKLMRKEAFFSNVFPA